MLWTAAPILRGSAVGAFAVTALSVWRSELDRDAKLTTILTCLSAAAWTLVESEQSLLMLGRPDLLHWLALPTAGFFWAFVVCVFQDAPHRRSTFAFAALFMVLGAAIALAPQGLKPVLLAAFNVTATGVCLHAMFLILRGWRGDLVDSRRSSRIVILGIAALFAVVQGAAGALHWMGRGGPWSKLVIGEDFGALVVPALGLAMGGFFLQARAALFSTPTALPEPAEAALSPSDRALLAKLEAFMNAGGWRQDGLTIGAVARHIGAQEHRLRRLINARLGHRNFADFVNRYRIEAAQLQLADPAKVDATIASIAFDLGYGSLSPFNRAFREVSGSSPTAWRRAALAVQTPPAVD